MEVKVYPCDVATKMQPVNPNPEDSPPRYMCHQSKRDTTIVVFCCLVLISGFTLAFAASFRDGKIQPVYIHSTQWLDEHTYESRDSTKLKVSVAFNQTDGSGPTTDVQVEVDNVTTYDTQASASKTDRQNTRNLQQEPQGSEGQVVSKCVEVHAKHYGIHHKACEDGTQMTMFYPQDILRQFLRDPSVYGAAAITDEQSQEARTAVRNLAVQNLTGQIFQSLVNQLNTYFMSNFTESQRKCLKFVNRSVEQLQYDDQTGSLSLKNPKRLLSENRLLFFKKIFPSIQRIVRPIVRITQKVVKVPVNIIKIATKPIVKILPKATSLITKLPVFDLTRKVVGQTLLTAGLLATKQCRISKLRFECPQPPIQYIQEPVTAPAAVNEMAIPPDVALFVTQIPGCKWE